MAEDRKSKLEDKMEKLEQSNEDNDRITRRLQWESKIYMTL